MKRVLVLVAALTVLWTATARAIEFSPIYELQATGGQTFFNGQKGSLAGNVDGTAAPAMKLDANWALLPTLNTAYSGTEQVLDVVGGQTLFQVQWDNTAALKGIYTPNGSDWRLKPSTSFKYEFLKETNDEPLGQGLFDYDQWGVGFEAEYLYRDPYSFHLSLDYYSVHFPNYTSLESQAATLGLARQLVGDYVLDTHDVLIQAGITAPVYDRLVFDGGLTILNQNFPNQHLVDITGDLDGPLRDDITTTLSAGLKMPKELNSDMRVLGALDLSASYNSSNQNSFDATQTRYVPYYYNYGQFKISPSIKLMVGPVKQPVVVGLSAAYWYRRYPYRPVQDPTGNYIGGDIRTDNWMLEGSVSYPISQRFDLVFDAQYGQGSSNMQFDEFFQYEYTVSSYWFGFSYKY